MRAKDFILQLSAKLPALVDDFTTSFSVSSLTRASTTVTATTTTAHGLSVGKSVNVVGAQTPITISTIDRVGIIATLVTAADHDMTQGAFTTVEISGATEAEFNGTFTLLKVPNRRTVTFVVADSGPTSATGSPILLNGSSALQSYNGLQKVTAVPTTTTFEYEITDTTLFTPASGTITAKTQPRISGAATDERALESYTKQATDQAWLYVVINDAVANKSRTLEIDGTDNIQRTNHFKQFISQTVSLFVFIPTSGQISGRKAMDRAQELFRPISQSILFAKFDSLLASGQYNALMFNEHGLHGYNTAFYIHRYTFEMQLLMGVDDTVGADEDVAFRDITMSQGHNVGTGVINSDIDLDDEPLP
jgi:hypothetical protein